MYNRTSKIWHWVDDRNLFAMMKREKEDDEQKSHVDT